MWHPGNMQSQIKAHKSIIHFMFFSISGSFEGSIRYSHLDSNVAHADETETAMEENALFGVMTAAGCDWGEQWKRCLNACKIEFGL